MDLFEFYSRNFKKGELVAVFKTAKNLLGYGILISQVSHSNSQSYQKSDNILLSDWSPGIGNSAWLTFINNNIVVVNEFDMEKL